MGAIHPQIVQGRTIVKNIAVVIAGHDKYSSAWKAMMHGLKTYWPDCPWPIYWMTNRQPAPKGCVTVKMGGDFNPKRWSNRMMRGLSQIPADCLLWALDDHWPAGLIDTDALIDFAKYIQKGLIHRIRLYPGWDHDRSSGVFRHDKRLLVMDKKSPYRASCKPSLWNKNTLLDLLKDNESPWDFERHGRKRSAKYTFLAVKDWGHFPFVTKGDPSGDWAKSPLIKGRWCVSAKRYCEREGLKIDFSRHPVETNPFGNDIPNYILS